MALTATATPAMEDEMLRVLGIPQASRFKTGFNRPNLYYEVWSKSDIFGRQVAAIVEWIDVRQYRERSGVIYCTTCDDTERLAGELTRRGLSVEYYHGQIIDSPGDPEFKSRAQRQADWSAGNTKLIVATSAFGMGVDKPDVRFVIHHSIAHSIEDFYQQSGRAGRDGLPADVLLLWESHDEHKIRWLFDAAVKNQKSSPDEAERKKDLLKKMVDFARTTSTCRRQSLLGYFGESFDPVHCNGGCDFCAPREPRRQDPVPDILMHHGHADMALRME
jgi:bloom syndrome protein